MCCCCCCRLGISCENKIYDQLNYFWVECDKERAAWSLSICCWLCAFHSRQLPVLVPLRWKTYDVALRIDSFDLLDTDHQNGVVKLLLLLWSCEWCCEYVCLDFIANSFIAFSFWPQIFTLDDIFLIYRPALTANVDVWEECEWGNGKKVAETAHLHFTAFKNWKKKVKKNGVVLGHSPLSTQYVPFKLVFLFFNYCYCWRWPRPLLLKLFWNFFFGRCLFGWFPPPAQPCRTIYSMHAYAYIFFFVFGLVLIVPRRQIVRSQFVWIFNSSSRTSAHSCASKLQP